MIRTIDTMTDLETSHRTQDGSRSSNGLQVLSRIAAVLDIPISDFYRHDAQVGGSQAPSEAECDRLLTAFLRVRDPEVRTRIIDMMRAYSGN